MFPTAIISKTNRLVLEYLVTVKISASLKTNLLRRHKLSKCRASGGEWSATTKHIIQSG